MTAADVMIETLINWGVEVIFGFPGDGINGIFESIRTHADKINFVQVRHEEAAAFMATGYAKFTGKLGVCLATSGPGGILGLRFPVAAAPAVPRHLRRALGRDRLAASSR